MNIKYIYIPRTLYRLSCDVSHSRDENHLLVINIELITCTMRRMVELSAPLMVCTFRWWFRIWYTCSKMGRTCSAIMGSVGFMADTTSLIHDSFRLVSLLMSQASCWSSERSTPWLNGRGFIDNIPPISTWNNNRINSKSYVKQQAIQL